MSKKKKHKKHSGQERSKKQVEYKGNKEKTTANTQKQVKAAKKQVAHNKSDEKDSLWMSPVFWGIAILLMVVTYLAYGNALDNDFVDWDDYTYVINNDLVRPNTTQTGQNEVGDIFKVPVSLNYHPLTIWSMRANDNVCPECMEGISAKPFIQWNIFIHILNALLVFFLIILLADNLYIAGLVALIFAIHPMHVESVAWVSERKDVLYTFFFLASALAFWKQLVAREKGNSGTLWYVLAFGLFILACLAKAMAVVLPLVLLLLIFWKTEKKGVSAIFETLDISNLVRLAPFFGVALFFGMMAVKVQGGDNFLGLLEIRSNTAVAINDFDTFSILQRAQFASYGFVMYLVKFFVPTDLCTFYPYPTQEEYDGSFFFTIAPILVLAIFGLAFYALKKTKAVAFGLAFYLVTVILVLQFLSVGVVIMADRYTYLPYIGLAFMLLMLVKEFFPENAHMPIYGAVGLWCVMLFMQTNDQVDTWQNSDTLWSRVIELHPSVEQPRSIRGNFYGKKASSAQSPEEQKLYLDKAFVDFQEAIRLGTQRADVYEGIGNIHGMRQKFEDALGAYSEAIRLNPKKGSVYFNRAVTYSMLGQHANAIADYTTSEQLYPEKIVQVRTNRTVAYINTKQYQEALGDLVYLLQVDPNNFAHHANRGVCNMSLGNKAAAIQDFQNALKLNPQHEASRKNLTYLQNQ
ncbi:MAG: tetratricopeptide repeat protein [Aureispira sp.]|nr:tetratricopeptide repeat protein [Aureispira sp.]